MSNINPKHQTPNSKLNYLPFVSFIHKPKLFHMKKIVLFLFIVIAFTACKSDEAKVDSMSSKDSTDSETYPYTATYSSKFEIGESKYSQTILKMWKAWDNGDLNS